jgi:hypothetical protein
MSALPATALEGNCHGSPPMDAPKQTTPQIIHRTIGSPQKYARLDSNQRPWD